MLPENLSTKPSEGVDHNHTVCQIESMHQQPLGALHVGLLMPCDWRYQSERPPRIAQQLSAAASSEAMIADEDAGTSMKYADADNSHGVQVYDRVCCACLAEHECNPGGTGRLGSHQLSARVHRLTLAVAVKWHNKQAPLPQPCLAACLPGRHQTRQPIGQSVMTSQKACASCCANGG